MNVVNWYVVIATVALCILNLVYMQKKRWKSVQGIIGKIKMVLPETNKKKIFFLIMLVSSLSLAVFMSVFYQGLTTLYLLKRVCLVTLIFPMAVIDNKRYIIPNKLLITSLICRGVILVFEFLFPQKNLVFTLTSEVISAFGLFVVCMIVLLIMKGKIGMGDVKLFSIMGLFQGFVGVSNAVLASLIIAFIVSVFLLIMKRKSRKDMIAFGPSILVGTFLSVILTGA
ncbi:prepilin peptidase [Anaerosacchariphilus polymeriproducens]|uniref:Prepilin peptidase n=1 Tax=Anaerosacchariphilus polymeriproducens TaxID=1812858 RepID=A0A371AV65_9FIRM|nr:A24 family peptidase [Anaerosacchariphilus polymeriproducens]RDU23432.1 prepilin peptidase [Anaerosacchariphilus polymeriproducens]